MKQKQERIDGLASAQEPVEFAPEKQRPIMRIFMDERDLYKEEMLYQDIKKQIASFHPTED